MTQELIYKTETDSQTYSKYRLVVATGWGREG